MLTASLLRCACLAGLYQGFFNRRFDRLVLGYGLAGRGQNRDFNNHRSTKIPLLILIVFLGFLWEMLQKKRVEGSRIPFFNQFSKILIEPSYFH